MKTFETNQVELKRVYDLLVNVCLMNYPLHELKPYVSEDFMAYAYSEMEIEQIEQFCIPG